MWSYGFYHNMFIVMYYYILLWDFILYFTLISQRFLFSFYMYFAKEIPAQIPSCCNNCSTQFWLTQFLHRTKSSIWISEKQTKQRIEIIRFWLRLSNMDSGRLTHKIFKFNCTKAINCKLKKIVVHLD